MQNIKSKKGINIVQLGESSAPAMFIVHGWGGTLESLVPLAKDLSSSYNVYLIDLPGFGESKMLDKGVGGQEYAGIVVEVMKELGLSSVIYVGHSFGGALGIYLSVNHPELISKLVIMAASIKREPKVKKEIAKLQKLPFYNILKSVLKPIRGVYYKVLVRQSDLPDHPELEETYRQLLKEDLRPLLPNVKQPTLILWGDQDTSTPLEDGQLAHEKIPNSKMKVYENMTHGLPIKMPHEVAKDIRNFLKGVE